MLTLKRFLFPLKNTHTPTRINVCLEFCDSSQKVFDTYLFRSLKGPLTCKCLMTSVDVYESLHHKIITCYIQMCIIYSYNNFFFLFSVQC